MRAVDVVTVAKAALEENGEMVARLVAIRKRFENWLHLEMYRRLLAKREGGVIEVERLYEGVQERCDLWLQDGAGHESWIELKCCVTNYAQDYTGPSSARPITSQIGEIIRDGEKLRRIDAESDRKVLLFVYPMPFEYRSHSSWLGHLKRLRAASLEVSELFAVPVHHRGKTAAVVVYSCGI